MLDSHFRDCILNLLHLYFAVNSILLQLIQPNYLQYTVSTVVFNLFNELEI